MTYQLDPQLATALAEMAEGAGDTPAPARGDWKATRARGEIGQAAMAALVPACSGVAHTQHLAASADGALIELRWYISTTRTATGPGAAVVYAHGGGQILGTLDLYDQVIGWYVDQTGVPFLSVGYRRAPDEGNGTTLAEDVYAGLTWLAEHATDLGIDPTRIAVMSGGGAPTAGAAILARDRGVPVAHQILIYPMLDDRNQTPDPARQPFLTWTYDNNYTAWNAVLGTDFGTDEISPIAAPAQLTDYAGLPPAYIEVGDLDIFRDEDIAYAQRLAEAGVPIELHVHPGAPHGWERIAPTSDSARRAMADRARVIASL